MYLKSIEINGFKSFAQKTVLEFGKGNKERNSITAIVGPNGSGKSNISDAIRWVTGEQKVTNLRAKKGEDVIFAGSDAKGKLGLASVSLVLDNADGRVPIEYSELALTRRLYRTGESEYLINGAPARLLDLQILLARAQFGQGSYSVIGQGTIDRMLLQNAAERKNFFDEATGIKEFQIKRHQAILKLARTKENITQADMILNEVSPRLKTLSRQVKKLEQRREIEICLREKQEQYYAAVWQFNESCLNTARIEASAAGEIYVTANTKLLALQEELAGLAREATRQEVFAELQRDYQNLVQKKNNLERERAIMLGKMQVEYSQAGRQDVGWIQNKIASLQTEEKKIAEELILWEKEAAIMTEEIAHLRHQSEKQMTEKTALRGQISVLEQNALQKKSEQSYFQYTGLRAVQAILEQRQNLGMVFGVAAQLGQVEQKYQVAIDVAAGANISSIVVDDETTAQACIKYLRQNQLGVATFLPINKIKARFVPRDIEDVLRQPGVLGLATSFVSSKEKFAEIFSYIFGNTVVVEDMDVARMVGIGRVRMVTLAGDIFETSGSIKGGWRRINEKGLSFYQGGAPHLLLGDPEAMERELLAKRREFEEQEIVCARQLENLRQRETQQQIAQGKIALHVQKNQELNQELASLQQEYSFSTMDQGEYATVLQEINSAKEKIDQTISLLNGEINLAQEKIDLFNQAEEKKKQRIFSLQDEMQGQQKEMNLILEKKNLQQIEIAKWETKQEDLAGEVYQEMQYTVDSIIKRGVVGMDLANLESEQAEIQKLKYQLSLIGGIEEGVFVEYEETKGKHDSLVNQLEDLKKALIDLEKMVEELDEIMKKRRDKAFKEIKKEFARFFQILFAGGKADLVEVHEYVDTNNTNQETVTDVGTDDLIADELVDDHQVNNKKILTGIDVVANPPGKKMNNIQALSGGERTLTSLALICAILHTNPSPFVVFDEVEAALDEANSLRFAQILQELAVQSQFIIITHNRATMHVADALYGVTMGGEGVSHLVSVNLEK